LEFRDLHRQYQALKADIDREIKAVLDSARFINGPQVSELEQELAAYVGVKHCISCANGTDALTMAMMTWGIDKGDAVFVPDFTFFSTGEIVSRAGATPVFVDVDFDTFNLSADALEDQIKQVLHEGRLRPSVVIAVDLFGLPADYRHIRKVCDQYGLLLLEDGAQGFGGSIGDQTACGFGDISVTSFFPSKPLGCYGDGGAVFTDSDEWADVLRSIGVHGKGKDKYDNIRIGLNSRLDTVQAAVLKVKFRAFREYELNAVNQAADLYSDLLNEIDTLAASPISVDTPGTAGSRKTVNPVVITPTVPAEYRSAWAQYTIRLQNKIQRDALQKFLNENGIPTTVFYAKPMHKQKAFSGIAPGITNRSTIPGTLNTLGTPTEQYDDDNDRYKNSIALADTVLSLPMHPYFESGEIEGIVKKIAIGVKHTT
jgi:dTDP-4-amino-4,6-dideoxygalactose transaminase